MDVTFGMVSRSKNPSTIDLEGFKEVRPKSEIVFNNDSVQSPSENESDINDEFLANLYEVCEQQQNGSSFQRVNSQKTASLDLNPNYGKSEEYHEVVTDKTEWDYRKEIEYEYKGGYMHAKQPETEEFAHYNEELEKAMAEYDEINGTNSDDWFDLHSPKREEFMKNFLKTYKATHPEFAKQYEAWRTAETDAGLRY